ncbi:MAG: DUF1186 domain-containing protein, partial [Cyanobacteria bacterium P01_F01_bin.143]
LEKWKDNVEGLVELPKYFLHIHALFLLAQFRETKAYPLIIDFFSTPGETAGDVTGDIVTEDLHRMLASVYDGNIEPLRQLIENPKLDEFVRNAGLKTLLILVAQEIVPRESIIEYFAELFTTRLQEERSYPDQETSYIWTNLVHSSVMLYPLELKEHIEQAFDADLVDLFYIKRERFEYYLNLGEDKALEKLRQDEYYSLIEDTISEMEWWACFRNKESKIERVKPSGVGKLELAPEKKSNSKKKSKKRTKNKMQKQARRKNRSKKK